MLIGKLHAFTSSRLAVIDLDATVQAAALSLARPGIGLVVVCNAGGGAEGVLSKSDLVRHLAGPGSKTPPVSDLMNRSIVSCSPQDDVHDVWQTMAARSLQNIPVIDVGARPLGILDIRDAMKVLFEQEEIQERMLFNYVTGVGYR
ncbi:CBS domain-containing protein [Mesorhizobium muleiense]|uniref:CBS domain-containing protein n=1 Tax=Mesorhizobium muleiense TaxID=1004279 RepID=A0A1G9CZN5_9HYPH|nr:CBS domain-containing protein [Mesorhizobium muleiense]MCF6102682.1 CBS domain-containing protein [Mesorhizobium muleiense]SDK56845.1 CBS domain-containing protein [Mesorhizobium muleiense]